MRTTPARRRRRLAVDAGAVSTEYVLVLVVVTMVALLGVQLLGGPLAGLYAEITTAL